MPSDKLPNFSFSSLSENSPQKTVDKRLNFSLLLTISGAAVSSFYVLIVKYGSRINSVPVSHFQHALYERPSVVGMYPVIASRGGHE